MLSNNDSEKLNDSDSETSDEDDIGYVIVGHITNQEDEIVMVKPYGTDQQLPIQGSAQGGATVNTWIYMVDDTVESLLGAEDANALGILKIISEGTAEKVQQEDTTIVGQVQAAYQVDTTNEELERMLADFGSLFQGAGLSLVGGGLGDPP